LGKIISDQEQLHIRGIKVLVEGKINKEYLLGKTREGRTGFEEIQCFVTVDADMTEVEKAAFVHEIERRCPVADNISNVTTLSSRLLKAVAIPE
jgi:uncharacterized OsmC-like protein